MLLDHAQHAGSAVALREAAILALGSHPDGRAVAVLAAVAEGHGQPQTLRLAAGDEADPALVQQAWRRASVTDPARHRARATALGRATPDAATPEVLVEALLMMRGQPRWRRLRGASWMAVSDDPRVAPTQAWLATAPGADSALRLRGIRGLVRQGTPEAAALLGAVAARTDQSAHLRRAAWVAMGAVQAELRRRALAAAAAAGARPGPAPAPVAAAEVAPVTEAVPVPMPAPVPVPVAETEAEAEAVAETEAVTVAESVTESETVAESVTETESETVTEAVTGRRSSFRPSDGAGPQRLAVGH